MAGCLQERDAKGADSDAKPGHLIPVAFQPRIARNGRGNMGDVVNALQAQSGRTGKGDAAPCVAFATRGRNGEPEVEFSGDVSNALRKSPGSSHSSGVATGMSVRRLTPTECERLQGFPDGHTAGFSDSVRYRMLGNAVAVPCAEWIARRLAQSAGGEA